MEIIYNPNLVSRLKGKYLFLDTNVFIGSLFVPELLGLIHAFKENGCELLTIPSVLFEFTRGTKTIPEYNRRVEAVKSICGNNVYPIERHLGEFNDFTVVLQHLKGEMDYTEFLLCASVYKFQTAKIITENHQHFPLDVLNREFLITVDNEKDIRNYAVYGFSLEKYNKAGEKILNSSR